MRAKREQSTRRAYSKMRRQILIGFAVVASIAAAAPDSQNSMEELIKKDYERLTGTFRLVSGMIDGKDVPEDVRSQTILVTDHDNFTVSDRGTAGRARPGRSRSIRPRHRRQLTPCKAPERTKGRPCSASMRSLMTITNAPARHRWERQDQLRSLPNPAATISCRFGND